MSSPFHDLEAIIARYNGAKEVAGYMCSFDTRVVQEQVKDANEALRSFRMSHPGYPVEHIIHQVLGGA